ncbi:MAG: (Fe-S)-binding protein [Paludibacter sp.]|nr:(Fe-S)-binding protein [Paludibacter sp.]
MKKKIDIQLFIPCYIDQLYPETGFNVIKILEKAGCTVHYNPEQTCCGQPAFNSGYWSETAALAEKFLNDFPAGMPVVSPSASCTGFISHHYHKVLKDRNDLMEKFALLKPQIYEMTDFLINVLQVENLGAKFSHSVTFHDSCSALREYGIKDEPRKLLANVEGLELVEMNESDTCCGFGGTFAVKNPHISTAMAENKVRNAIETGAEFIVSTEASCLMNINGYCAKNKLPLKGIHLADILASGY